MARSQISTNSKSQEEEEEEVDVRPTLVTFAGEEEELSLIRLLLVSAFAVGELALFGEEIFFSCCCC